MLSKEFIQKMKEKLIQEKQEVQKKIDKFSKTPEPGINPDSEDAAQQASDRDLSERLLAAHKEILEKIDRALAKIEKGTYGLCEKCDLEASVTELEKDPWAEHCGQC